MEISPTLTAAEFADIHNGKCKLHFVLGRLNGVLAPSLLAELQSGYDLIEKGLARSYELENETFNEKMDAFKKFADEKGLRNSTWSIYDVSLEDEHPYKDATHLMYVDHSGPGKPKVEIKGKTWGDLFIAADQCIAQSGDSHHIFVESITPHGVAGILKMSTGS